MNTNLKNVRLFSGVTRASCGQISKKIGDTMPLLFIYYFSCVCSDVNCGLLFCDINGIYQWTADVFVDVYEYTVSSTTQCL